jgi:hypothetical protein
VFSLPFQKRGDLARRYIARIRAVKPARCLYVERDSNGHQTRANAVNSRSNIYYIRSRRQEFARESQPRNIVAYLNDRKLIGIAIINTLKE